MLTFAVFLVACRNNDVLFHTSMCSISHWATYCTPVWSDQSYAWHTASADANAIEKPINTFTALIFTAIPRNIDTHGMTRWLSHRKLSTARNKRNKMLIKHLDLSLSLVAWCSDAWVTLNADFAPGSLGIINTTTSLLLSHCCEQNKLTLHPFWCNYNFVFVFHLQKQLNAEWNWCRRHGECTNDKHWTFVTVQKWIFIAL